MGVFPGAKFLQAPSPIEFRMGLLTRKFSRPDVRVGNHRVCGWNVDLEIIGLRSAAVGILDIHDIGGIVFLVEEARHPQNPIAVGTSGIASKSESE